MMRRFFEYVANRFRVWRTSACLTGMCRPRSSMGEQLRKRTMASTANSDIPRAYIIVFYSCGPDQLEKQPPQPINYQIIHPLSNKIRFKTAHSVMPAKTVLLSDQMVVLKRCHAPRPLAPRCIVSVATMLQSICCVEYWNRGLRKVPLVQICVLFKAKKVAYG